MQPVIFPNNHNQITRQIQAIVNRLSDDGNPIEVDSPQLFEPAVLIQTTTFKMNGSKSSSPHSQGDSNEENRGIPGRKDSKVSKPRLTAEQKNDNHKEAENKRRTAIRETFAELSQLVPGTAGQERSEQVMLTKTSEYLAASIREIRELELQAAQMGLVTNSVGQLKDTDYGGSQWQQPNLDKYHKQKAKKASRRGEDVDADAEAEEDG